jgi:uncharacterized membrane protein
MTAGRGAEGESRSVSHVRGVPADLAAVVTLVGLATLAVFVPVVSESPVRVVLGLPLVLVAPGYAVVAALFPGDGDAPTPDSADSAVGSADATPETRRGIDGIERAALSVGLSIPVVTLLGLGLSLTSLGVSLVPMLVVLDAVTLGATAVAVRRRRRLPADEQFAVPYRRWLAAGRGALFGAESRTTLALNVVLALSVLLAAGSVTYAVAAPNEGESFTEFYLLTENETGSLVADDYPTEFTVGESRPVVVGVENHEQAPTNYTVVAELQRVEIDGDEATVVETSEFERFGVDLGAGETWRAERPLAPTMAGERLRVAYLLYRGSPPADPSRASAYRHVQLWVNVSRS